MTSKTISRTNALQVICGVIQATILEDNTSVEVDYTFPNNLHLDADGVKAAVATTDSYITSHNKKPILTVSEVTSTNIVIHASIASAATEDTTINIAFMAYVV